MDALSDYGLFEPCVYLREYYGDLGSENRALLRFLVAALRDTPPGAAMLDFGGGPTLYAAIAAAPWVADIHLTDYSDANLAEVRRWLAGDPAAYSWHEFTREILRLEGVPDLPEDVARREALTRRRVTRVSHCDAKAACPVLEGPARYDLLVTNFCLEAAAGDVAEWRQCMETVLSCLRPGGRLILSAVQSADSYAVGDRSFVAVRIQVADMVDLLGDLGFDAATIVTAAEPADRAARQYEGLMFAAALKRVDGAGR